MKKLIISAIAVTAFAASSFAGPGEYSNQVQQQSNYRPADEFYRDREWNFDLFGAYAFTARPYRSDQYLGVDHAWGGGLNVNYMFNRYLGVGVEGYALAADDVVGQASGNLIFRYPIPGTRVAPYGFAGGGVIFNGSRVEDLVDRGRSIGSIRRNSDAEGMGQFGAGFEFRITPNVGVINDFSWNVVNGERNDFGMVRSGVRFAF
ncbi:MAG: outer membrane beta-barrel protein [Chthoniobacterales bacterium]|nr:outer membrane beta-barrel protein [Chthoniobacterales bacterium]